MTWKSFNASLINVRCGNSVVEGSEKCDCGSLKQCYSNKCCNTDCSLKGVPVCDKEMCYTDCMYATPGCTLRPIQNIRDLPECCPGGTYLCPQNFYLQDGTPCTEEGYCYHGNCTDRTMHCQEIFGRHAVNADDSCYTINTKATRFGHCSRRAPLMTFNPCQNADIKCGRLQCGNVTHLPRLPDHASFHQSKISQVWCWGLDTHIATGINDVGHVRNGTPCAPGTFCENNFYNASIAAITYDCNPEKCSFRGVCNNRRNCHCRVGWDPPYCADKGAGGSQDSGSPPRMMRSVKQSQQSVVYLRVVFGRIYAFIAALLLGVATNVKVIKTSTVQEVTLVKVHPAALQETFTEAPGFLNSAPDCTSWTCEWTPVHKRQNWMSANCLALDPSSNQRPGNPLPVTTATRERILQLQSMVRVQVRVQVQVQEELQEQAQGLPAGLVELGPVLGLLREQAQPLLASMVFPHLALGLLLD
ncbi:LOW QUALITY PROTEIN: disintegrin and metalloproteinase domain-containing protein 29-like [Camelus dromedarius]|uniref:LOW QUALITY PROTEIN: disintegrin and metalloproteinase domain-containing protein 29-like n=1 Tax=Camelus dromedarius TaxID=9838 RepID=UPI00311A1919